MTIGTASAGGYRKRRIPQTATGFQRRAAVVRRFKHQAGYGTGAAVSGGSSTGEIGGGNCQGSTHMFSFKVKFYYSFLGPPGPVSRIRLTLLSNKLISIK